MQSSLRAFFASSLVTPLALLLAPPSQAADLAAGRTKVQTLCQVCHGMDGVAILAEAANLSGQQKGYIEKQLRAFRTGSRQDPQMSIIAKALTDIDIDNLAEWYSAIKVTVEVPK
jgi:cytochrome c553